jgi:tetratricopeptide (TPR) repeat protein
MKNTQISGPRPRLSAAMIVCNEQDVIAETLDSIRAITDEIIVWDSGSEDETVSIARKKGAKVFQGFWKNDFSAARNACLEKVSGDWVLWLNAGEQLSADTRQKLREFIDSSAELNKAYLLMVEIPSADSRATGEQIAQPRLLPVKAGLKFEGRVRETLYRSIQAAGLEMAVAPGRIIRHSRQHSQVRKCLLAQRDLELVALEQAEKEEPETRLYLAQGEAYINMGVYDKAREAFSRAIEIAEYGSSDMLEGYYGLLTCYNSDQSLRDTQINVCFSALKIFPFDTQLLLAMGNYFQIHNLLDLAAQAFGIAVKFGKINSTSWHLCELPEVAASFLVMILQLQGKNEEAAQVLEEALKCHPQSARLPRVALDFYIKQGQEDKALETAKRSGAISGEDDPLVMAIRGACLAATQNWTPALALLQSAYLMDCRKPLCLRWLAVTLLSNGQIESAKPVLAEWQQLEPANPELLSYLAAVQEKHAFPDAAKAEEPADDSESALRRYRIDPGAPITELMSIRKSVADQSPAADSQNQEQT